ncbi:carbohydrate sulfotransferase 11-like [Penaeus japonicus]|uniref:carbohydrate sulfotransferase 11-like n=1 Tax=Penaeus japonicus TaxID=27405 RepID=UPI001C713EE9|nr:carbohydrate sulfotransferase 11-like [Penaeus japonicus]
MMPVNMKLAIFLFFTLVFTLLIGLKEAQIKSKDYEIHIRGTTPRNLEDTNKNKENKEHNNSNNKQRWEDQQEKRKQAVREACRGQDREYLLERLLESPRRLGHLLVDDQHRAIYCYIPKVSCTTWKRVWAALTGHLKTSKNYEIPNVLPHYLTKRMSLLGQKLSRKELQHKIQTYTKFLAVRHPLERLLSAFRNKFESNSSDAKVFKRIYGAQIIRKYRRGAETSRMSLTSSYRRGAEASRKNLTSSYRRGAEASRKNLTSSYRRGTGASRKNLTSRRSVASAEDLKRESAKNQTKAGEGVRFSEFVSFLLHKKDLKSVNEHWRPYEYLCYPCAVSYDVIGKYETLQEDSERFLRLIGAPEGLHFPRYMPTNTSVLLDSYLASVRTEQLMELTKAYQRDFQLFQYDVGKLPEDRRYSNLRK